MTLHSLRLKFKKKHWIAISLVIAIGLLYWLSLPALLFNDPYSTVLNDRHGNLLSASIANDGQWRFPLTQQVPKKFAIALVQAEDKRFYHHPGVDFFALVRATQQNLRAWKIVSGGSTLSMQVIRLARKKKSRTFFEKIIELILATRLEWRYSKDEILSLYTTHAPMGGNVVGLEAACWRYFGRSTAEISWAEAATLAVLPNAPSLMHLGKNRLRLKNKRNRLLAKLSSSGYFDTLTLKLAQDEPLPESPLPLPRLAPHLLNRAIADGKSQQKITTSVEGSLQLRTTEILSDHYQRLKINGVFNTAAIIAEVKTGNVLAYVGNTLSGKENNEEVDVIAAPRSTGSILKPFLFAAMLNEGKMLPGKLWPDVPTLISGFSPKNFSKEFDGAVPAHAALIRSLNIPAVYELQEYRYEKFYDLLKNIGITTLSKPASHYGLSLILGGAEATLWDITGTYASLARTLNHYFETPGKNRYSKNDFHSLTYIANSKKAVEAKEETSWLSAASVYLTFDALKELYRPGEGSGWKNFSSTKKIAWKTGTSFGFRDGWAVGVNPDYVVGVWVGNADGEGRPNLTGTETAAPILFDLFSMLPGNAWFQAPESEMEKITVCKKSGHRATELCNEVDTIKIYHAGLTTLPCPYHKKIFLSADQKFRVHANCESLSQMVEVSWFVLPPVEEHYYKIKHPGYHSLPPFRNDCSPTNTIALMDIVYPKYNSKVVVPIELDGSSGNLVFEAAHRNKDATIFWHLDGNFIASTKKTHKLALQPKPGNHILLLIDDSGESLSRPFSTISTR